MDFATLDKYCLSQNGVTFEYPFDEKTRVYKVAGKMFALTVDTSPLVVNLKCDPLYALELRSLFEDITPGYHMNKKHWNSVIIDSGLLTLELITSLIDESYALVVAKLTKKERTLLLAK
jgi:predicted DNA-binding protein (MmcQ/YjbR family)